MGLFFYLFPTNLDIMLFIKEGSLNYVELLLL